MHDIEIYWIEKQPCTTMQDSRCMWEFVVMRNMVWFIYLYFNRWKYISKAQGDIKYTSLNTFTDVSVDFDDSVLIIEQTRSSWPLCKVIFLSGKSAVLSQSKGRERIITYF